ncbi:hypothetical protein BD410DRAFT_787027 [Rickenella mellea]|uniref:Uncharacterized protein n=1 Tax=Rickenella mellea TaxID=50990 RepID=A0A4Y7QAA6_9AGAM|nr:hypothetical protein BD410DRAFT_787027 [Rickenella mellea]
MRLVPWPVLNESVILTPGLQSLHGLRDARLHVRSSHLWVMQRFGGLRSGKAVGSCPQYRAPACRQARPSRSPEAASGMPRLSQVRVARSGLMLEHWGDRLFGIFQPRLLLVRPSSARISDICFQCQHQC